MDPNVSPTDVQDTALLNGNMKERIYERNKVRNFYDVEEENGANNRSQPNCRFGDNTSTTIIDHKHHIAATMASDILTQDVLGVHLVEDINGGGVGYKRGAAGSSQSQGMAVKSRVPAMSSSVPATKKAGDDSPHVEYTKRLGKDRPPPRNPYAKTSGAENPCEKSDAGKPCAEKPRSKKLSSAAPAPCANSNAANGYDDYFGGISDSDLLAIDLSVKTSRNKAGGTGGDTDCPDAPKNGHGSNNASQGSNECSPSPPEVPTQMVSSPFTPLCR